MKAFLELVVQDGTLTTEAAIVCAALVLAGWLGVAARGSSAHTTAELRLCPACRRPTAFQRRPGAWVAVTAGLSWGVLLYTRVPSVARWFAPALVWGALVALHPKRCALCRTAMGMR